MKRKPSLKTLGLLALVSASAAGVISSTYAWFSNTVEVPFEGLVRNAYFKSGTGTSSEDPFIIAHPVHLYNLAWLQYIGYFNKDELTKDQSGSISAGSDGVIDQQYYFKIELEEGEENLDMSGWVLPPIGTTRFPFLGHFDGNNVDIVNLKTSNFSGEGGIQKLPSSVTSLADLDIIGFFGVVGEYGNLAYTFSESANAVVNFGLDNYTVKTANGGKLVGLAAGYVNGTFSGVAVGECTMDIPQGTTALDSTNLTANLSDFGTVGYCTEGHIGTTSITTTTVDTPAVVNGNTDNMGNEWGGSVPMKYFYDDAKDQLTTDNYPKYVSSTTTNYDRDHGDAPIGEPIIKYGTYSTIQRRNSGKRNFQYLTGERTDDSGDILSSYSIAGRLSDSNPVAGAFDDQWIYLYGKKDAVATVENGRTVTSIYHQQKSGQTIADNGTYLTNSSGSLSGSTTQTVWIWDGTKLYSNYNNTAYYLTRGSSQDTGRYLVTLTTTKSSGVDLSFDQNTKRITYSYNNSTYYLDYYKNNWEFRNQTTESYYTIDYGGTYFCNSGKTVSASTDIANASHLTRDNYGRFSVDGYYISDSNNRTSGFRQQSLSLREDTNYALENSTSSTYLQRRASSGWINVTCRTWNLELSGGKWGIYYQSQEDSYATPHQALNIVYHTDTIDYQLTVSAKTTDETRQSQTNQDSPVDLKPTYFPLNAHRDANKKTIRAASANTGYVVSGTYYNNNSTLPGDIRVSRYGFSQLSKSTNSSSRYATATTDAEGKSKGDCRLEILTRSPYYDSGNSYVRISDGYNFNNPSSSVSSSISSLAKKPYFSKEEGVEHLGFERYENARQKLDELFTNDPSNVYGLHFMDAAITADHTIRVPKATVNELVYKDNKAYECEPVLDSEGKRVKDANDNPLYTVKDYAYDIGGNLELPEDAIDFTLAKDGRINFFAASYFSGNSAFFSLHEIQRSSQTYKRDGGNEDITIPGASITGIREVLRIYKNTEWGVDNDFSKPQFVMEYDTGSPSEGTKGDLLFDMDWIKNASDISSDYSNAMFYFEIPVIKGEYALGSVNNHDGAYLVYLDIGAADINADVTLVNETITELTKYFNYPIGVEFVTDPSGVTNKSTITGGKVAAIFVPASTEIESVDVATVGVITFELEDLTPTAQNPASKKLSCGPPSTSGAIGASFISIDTTVESGDDEVEATEVAWKRVTTENNITYTYSTYTNLFSTVINKTVTTRYSDPEKVSSIDKSIINNSESCTDEEYAARKINLYGQGGGPESPYFAFDYEIGGYSGDEDPETQIMCTLEWVYSYSDNKYHYYFTISSTVADIVVVVTGVPTDGNFLAYINGTLVAAGDRIPVSKSA